MSGGLDDGGRIAREKNKSQQKNFIGGRGNGDLPESFHTEQLRILSKVDLHQRKPDAINEEYKRIGRDLCGAAKKQP